MDINPIVHLVNKEARKVVSEIYPSLGFRKISWCIGPRTNHAYANLKEWKIVLSKRNIQRSERLEPFYEYKSFENSPYIGTFYPNTPEDFLKVLISHETAHLAAYSIKKTAGKNCQRIVKWSLNKGFTYFKKEYKNMWSPHGPVWKSLYHEIRKRVLENSLEKGLTR